MKLMCKLMTGAGMLALSSGFAAAAPAVVQNDVNLRAGPGVEFPVIAAMPAGARVDVTGCQGSWCQVAFNGTAGWASRAYMGLGGGVAAAPTYGYADTYSYGSYGPGYRYGYYGDAGFRGSVGFSERGRTFGNERRFGEETTVRGERRLGERTTIRGEGRFNEQGAVRGARVNASVGAGAQTEKATAIKGNNPMRVRESTASSKTPGAGERATAIKGNNPMRIRESAGASSSASATTGAAPRESNRRRENR